MSTSDPLDSHRSHKVMRQGRQDAKCAKIDTSFYSSWQPWRLGALGANRAEPRGFEFRPAWLSCSPMSSQPSGPDPIQQIQDIAIERKPFEGEVYDVMGGSARWEVKVHEHGLVALVDVMPRFAPVGKTADFAIVQAARVSYGAGTKQVNEDRGLIRSLARHRHTTPFEMVEFKFHHVMPIFVARQWIRHRTANVNEYSARYSVVRDRFFKPSPENVRRQSTSNRQGGEEPMDNATAQDFLIYLDEVEKSYERYQEFLEKGVS